MKFNEKDIICRRANKTVYKVGNEVIKVSVPEHPKTGVFNEALITSYVESFGVPCAKVLYVKELSIFIKKSVKTTQVILGTVPVMDILQKVLLILEMDIELLINNINAEAPDVLFLITGEVKQVELLKQIKPMLNAKLCVCMGDVLDDFIFLLKDRNTFMEKLQFFSKCKGLFSKQMIHNKIIDRIFKNRIRKSNQGKEN